MGKNVEEVLSIAQDSIERVLNEYKPSVSSVKGVEKASKIIEEWVERENERNNIFTTELEINNYPENIRRKFFHKDYISNIYEMTNCNVSVRGVFVENGKKPPPGQKKMYLYIQGNSKIEVSSAYREIKRTIDELALNYYSTGGNGVGNGYTGAHGRYSVFN